METLTPVCRFQLFVAGNTPNSLEALSNLTRLCREHLPGRHEIDVIDVFLEPSRALAERIFMTPTLIRQEPSPLRIVGTLGNAEPLFLALGLQTAAS